MTDALSMFADPTYDRLATTPEEALAEAVRRAGGQAVLARSLAISKQPVQLWRIAPVRACSRD
jgi:hypothetical protein